MRLHAPLKATFAVVFVACLAASLRAQTTGDTAAGLTPFHGGDIDQINLSNGNLVLRIPLVNYPQRGALKLSFSFVENSKIAATSVVCEGSLGCPVIWESSENPPPFNQVDDDEAFYFKEASYQPDPKVGVQIFYAAVSPDGSLHPMLPLKSGGELSIDATGFWINGNANNGPDPTLLIDRNGIRYPSGPIGTREDTNGNQITTGNSGYTDTMGRVIPWFQGNPAGTSTTDFSGCTGPLPIASARIWSVLGLNGGTIQFKFCEASVTINIPKQGLARAASGTTTVTQSIVLPNGTAWTFEYGDGYGVPTQITLPTGGTISYTYVTNPGFVENSLSRWVTSRTFDAHDGTGPHTFTYAYTLNTGSLSATIASTKATDPLGNDTVHTFTVFGNDGTALETETQFYQGSSSGGTLLKTVQTDYNNFAPNGNPEFTSPGVVPIRATTTWPNGQVSKTETDYDFKATAVAPGNYITIPYGDIIAKREYGFGSGSPGSLLRTTTTQYEAFLNSSYLTNNLLSLPDSVTVTNSAGTQVAQTLYGYDGYSLVSSGITTQHGSSPDGSVRGNQTSVSKWLNTTNSDLSTTSTYFDTGEVHTVTDPKSNTTTFAYSSSYAGAYPTTITNALNQSVSHAYDFNTGLVTSTADANNQTTAYTYDNMQRIASVSYPDRGKETFTHQESSFPFSATLTEAISSSQNKVSVNVFDGMGRVMDSELTSDPAGTDIAATTYDADGRVASVSNPYRTTSDPTYGLTSSSYDALDRPTLVVKADGSKVTTAYCGSSTLVTDEAGKWRRSAADALGRLIEVDEPSSPTETATACSASGSNITTYAYDALNNLTGVSQGGRTRSFVYDSLSRLTSSTNPETGTISYSYDPDGNVLTRTDARGITTTYSYDALDRLTQKTYSDGTPTATYLYDVATTNGETIANPIGRLVRSAVPSLNLGIIDADLLPEN